MSGFRFRGVVEGFYGDPWTHEDRLWLLERMGAWDMNLYVYAPKDDPFHLERWRDPYPADALARFRALIAAGKRAGVRVAFAVSPGRTMVYSDAAECAALVAKYRQFAECGADAFALALDDVPTRLIHEADQRAWESLGHAHAALAASVYSAFPEAFWWLVPTDYVGVGATDDLSVLADCVPAGVEIAWTGRTVVSPEILAAEAAERAAVLGRKPLIWDNVPVNDGPMRTALHLGPYAGREPGLVEHASGVLLNPMDRVRASAVTLACAAEYLSSPASYDAEAAWSRAVRTVGGAAADAFETFARAHRFTAQTPDDRDAELEAVYTELEGATTADALDRADALVAVRIAAGERLQAGWGDDALARELAPWLASFARETRCIRRALRVLRTLADPAKTPSEKVLAFFAMQGGLNLDAATPYASYGPRRLAYPQFTSMRDDEMGYGPDPPLYLDRCLSDAFVALAERRALAALRDPALP